MVYCRSGTHLKHFRKYFSAFQEIHYESIITNFVDRGTICSIIFVEIGLWDPRGIVLDLHFCGVQTGITLHYTCIEVCAQLRSIRLIMSMDIEPTNDITKRESQFGYRGNYGLELIADLKGCELEDLTQERITKFLVKLCELIKMKRHGDPMYWEDWSGIPSLHGISAVQFVETSNIVCHALSIRKAVYLNIFSCKEFDTDDALKFCSEYWGSTSNTHTVVMRV